MTKEITIDGETYRRVDNEKSIEEQYVRVPENIHFTLRGELLFNDDQQVLYALKGNYGVSSSGKLRVSDETRYLVPCERSDLEPGDVVLMLCSWENVKDWSSILWKYVCILDEKRYAYISDKKDVRVHNSWFSKWYRVMTKKEIQKMRQEQ
jgi:hypothetical protein